MAGPTIVLVHGAFADASSFRGLYDELLSEDVKIIAPPNPLRGVSGGDGEYLRGVIDEIDGPVLLVGHSYGGSVITAAGTADNVVGLVYVAAFGIDEGESLGALLGGGPPTPALANLEVDAQGFGWLPEDDFVGHFAADVEPSQARIMYAVQQPISMSTFEYTMGVPAWRDLPSWYVVAVNDEAIPPDAERQFAKRMGATTIEVESGHLAMVTQSAKVIDLIEQAAAGQA